MGVTAKMATAWESSAGPSCLLQSYATEGLLDCSEAAEGVSGGVCYSTPGQSVRHKMAKCQSGAVKIVLACDAEPRKGSGKTKQKVSHWLASCGLPRTIHVTEWPLSSI